MNRVVKAHAKVRSTVVVCAVLACLALPSVAHAQAPPTLTLSPAVAENPLGRVDTVTATLTDTDGQRPQRPYTIQFTVEGANGFLGGACRTDFDGQCGFGYTGGTAGTDAIHAFADSNDNGLKDPDEPTAIASKIWTQPTPGSTPGCAGGVGTLQTNAKASFAFGVRYRAGAPAPEGLLGFTDRVAGKSLASQRLTSVIIVGSRATIRGEGRTNGGQTVAFRVDVDDLSANGRLDTFAIQWPGYSAAGTLRAGNIALTCPHDHDDD